MISKDPILLVENLKVYYYTERGVVKAVDGVSLNLRSGEILCFVGESGSGKSTLAYAIAGLIDPPGRIVDGRILFKGKELFPKKQLDYREVLGRDITVIFQDPRSSLNPVLSIGEQITEIMVEKIGLDRGEAYKRAIELLKATGIPDPELIIKRYPHELSGGMAQRVVIAVALSTNPSLVIADEPTTALDVTIQARIVEILRDLVKRLNSSMIFITHDLSLAYEVCDRVLVMYAGKIVEEGVIGDVIDKPLHPYTKALLDAIPRLGAKGVYLRSIPGDPPNLIAPPSGCRFHPRCPYASEICRIKEPDLKLLGDERRVACHLY